MNQRVIIDMDNTMGVKGCDVDDGLALLMLLGTPGVTIEGACSSYGNSTIDTVHANTEKIFDELGLDIPLYRGSVGPEDPISDAARYLASCAADNPKEITVIATGSLTNLRGAAEVDPAFFDNLKSIVLMGGYTRSLYINGRIMDELNTSCDAEATYQVLNAACPVYVATAQNCMPAFFSTERFSSEFSSDSWLGRTCAYWFDDMNNRYNWDGWVCWDVVATSLAVLPELFTMEEMDVTLNRRWLSVGYFEKAQPEEPSARIFVPRITDIDAFMERVIASWHTALRERGLDS